MNDLDVSLRERVERWLTTQMPFIEMHGGESMVRVADEDTGEVVIELGGTCRGCAISAVTTGNIQGQLSEDVNGVTDVTVRVPEAGDSFGIDQPESIMGIDQSPGGRG